MKKHASASECPLNPILSFLRLRIWQDMEKRRDFVEEAAALPSCSVGGVETGEGINMQGETSL